VRFPVVLCARPRPNRIGGVAERISSQEPDIWCGFERAFDMSTKHFDKVIEQLAILIVDGNQYSRKLTRTMLMNVGAKTIMESPDGVTALDLIRNNNPDVAIIEWDLPVLSGPELVRIVRSPGVFPKPFLPIVMLTAVAQQSRVSEAVSLGVHEFLVKPTSPRALRDRLLSILINPRQMVQTGEHCVPEPRKTAAELLRIS
jgi:two-component system, chemotaxis family, chemotaxis protein CheY